MQQRNFNKWKHLCLIKWLMIFVIIISRDKTTEAAKILGLFPHASESHFMVMRTFMMELARKEHNVTLYSSHRLDDRMHNLQEYIVEPEFPFWEEVQKQAGTKDIVELSKLSDEKLSKSLSYAGLALMEYFLNNNQMQELLKTSPESFDYDLIVVDLFYTESLMALGYYFGAPVIGITSSDFGQYMQKLQEALVPSACLPYDVTNYNTDIGFWQRLDVIRECKKRRQGFMQDHYGNQEKLIEKHFNKNQGSIPSIMQLNSYLSLLLVNDYYPLRRAKPVNPNIIPVGGIHIRAPRELPWHLRRFLDEARAGAIYINLGDEHDCAKIPKDKLDALQRVFSQRNERFLWTCHDVQSLEGLPKNVMIQHLVSQTDILAHPHVQLFIMNGDLMGLQEAIVRHVPIVGLPLFKNEMENINLVEKFQIGLRLDFTNITENSLNWALDTVIRKEFYVFNIRVISKVFRDRPLGGLASALFWVDYILSYGGQPLQTLGIGIPLNELHLNDILIYNVLLVTIVIGCLAGLYFVGMFLWKKQGTKITSKIN